MKHKLICNADNTKEIVEYDYNQLKLRQEQTKKLLSIYQQMHEPTKEQRLRADVDYILAMMGEIV